MAQNEANSGRGRVGRGPRGVGRGAIVRNKANLAITAGIRKRIVQNEANLRSSGRPDGPGTRRRMAATPKDWRAVCRRVR
jgi:hypothetical protein